MNAAQAGVHTIHVAKCNSHIRPNHHIHTATIHTCSQYSHGQVLQNGQDISQVDFRASADNEWNKTREFTVVRIVALQDGHPSDLPPAPVSNIDA